jgi:hypothetical protein
MRDGPPFCCSAEGDRGSRDSRDWRIHNRRDSPLQPKQGIEPYTPLDLRLGPTTASRKTSSLSDRELSDSSTPACGTGFGRN